MDDEMLNQMDMAYDQYEEAMINSSEEEKKSNGSESFQIDDMSIGMFLEHGDHIYTLAQHPRKANIILSGGGDYLSCFPWTYGLVGSKRGSWFRNITRCLSRFPYLFIDAFSTDKDVSR